MPIKNDREYRSFAVEMRAEEENQYIVEGYASTFEAYPIFEDYDGTVYNERIERDAFNEADLTDVVFLLDHSGRVYARTKNNTVSLSIDDHGLLTRTDLSRTEGARQVAEDIRVGNYSQMSFAFTVAEDHFERETNTRVIDRVKKVFDISAVAFPANPGTDIGISMRDYFHGEMEKVEAERLQQEKLERMRDEVRAKAKALGGSNGN